MKGRPPKKISGQILKARRMRFIEPDTGLPLSQKQFAQLVGLNTNTVAINERGDFTTPAQQRNWALVNKALNWIEYRSGLVPWDDLGEKEQQIHLLFAKETASTRHIEPRRLDTASPGRSTAKRAAPFGLSVTDGENTNVRFGICIGNDGHVDDLKVRAVYQILPDESAARSNYVRVVDESGEDYLYPSAYFVPVEVPPEAVETFVLSEVRDR